MTATPTIGFSSPILAAAASQAMVQGVVWVAETRGANVVVADAQLDVTRQIEQLEALVRLSVDAILVYPVGTPAELRPALDRIADAGILLFSHDDVDHPAVITELCTPGDRMARLSAELVRDQLDGSGLVVIVDGIAAPQIRERTDEFRRAFAEYGPGITVIGEAVNETDDAQGGRRVVIELLEKLDTPDAIIAYNDASALGAADAVEAAGLSAVIVGCNGEPECLEAIRFGRIAGTVERHPIELAQRGTEVILDVLSGAIDRDEAPRRLTAEVEVITASNVDDFLPWPKRTPEPDWSRTCRYL